MTKDRQKEMNIEIGKRLRYFRQMRGYNQTELANRLDLSYQQIQKYETGEHHLNVTLLCLIAKKLDIPFHDFLPQIYLGTAIPSSEPDAGILAGKLLQIKDETVRHKITMMILEQAGKEI